MKNSRIFKQIIIALIITLGSIHYSEAQIKNPFDVRFQTTVRGDLTMISNNIVNRSPNQNTAYNGTNSNDGFDMQYIDIDGSNQTFNSSSANLVIQDASCSRIVHAGLYWSATYRYNVGNLSSSGRENDWNQVKFRVPGGNYVDIVADDVLYNSFGNPDQTNVAHGPYACFADVTSLISGLANPNGTYFVGNIRVSRNTVGNQTSSISGGISGGWTLVIVYENINLPGKKITTFDGYAVIASGAGNLDIPVSGFNTLPAPLPVRAKLGVSTLEGDRSISNDRLRIKADSNATFTDLSNTPLPAAAVFNNYFNSSITLNGAFYNARNPNSSNTLGWDAHLNSINNPANSVIPNDETGVILQATSDQDKYDIFFTSFDVEIIEPQIPLIKEVEDTAGNNVNNQTLSLGQEIFYTLTFQNTGNDDAINFTITDVLPTNALFPANGTIQPGDVILPPGVTYTFNPTLNQFTFTIPNNLVEIGDPAYTIRIKVRLPDTCQDFRDACTNQIINQAFVSYTGVLNNQIITDNPSFNGYDSCSYPTPGTTNFIADIDDCVFNRTEILCGNSVELTAPDGYDTYQWEDSNGNSLGNTQTITVNSTGSYIVYLSVPPPCVSIFETVTVVDFNNAINTNPVTPYADVVEICPNDGTELPKIFLCGLDDSVLIQSGINDAVSIDWQLLVPGSCPPVGINNCANTNPSCTWNTVGTGPNFNVTTAGEYQVIFTYQNGCFRRFYFNVFQNVLDPDIVTTNIVCNTQGTITINNIPSTYEFSLSPTGPFQTSNTFNVTSAGVYTVYIQQSGVNGGCLFEYPNINILEQILDVDVIVEDKLCNDGFGSIRIQINDVNPQYYYQIAQGGTTISTFGPSIDNDHLFSNLNPGTYTVTASTDDGCIYTQQVTIQDLSDLDLVATVSQHIGCNQGNIQVNPSGGQPPYNYAIYSYNGVLVNPSNYVYQTSVIFDVQSGQQGDYQFLVIDSNNCISISNEVTINLEPPVTLSETHTNVTCNGLNNGTITVQTGPTNGYNVSFSIDNGTSYQSSNVFNNLTPGTYTIIVRFSRGNRVCEYSITVTITEPDVLIGESEVVQQLSCVVTGSIQAINVSGGTAPYQYSINGITFQASNVFTNLNAGTYTITIRDANNCVTTTDPITFVQPLPPTDIAFTSSSLTCPALTSNVTATITGGTAPYTAQITSPSTINATSVSGNVATFNNLAVGSYTFVVTDVNGCTYQENFTINPIPFINVTGNLVSNVVCFGTSTGAVTFNVSNISTTYSYTINGGTPVTNQTSSTINLTNLAAGNYTIVVTDTNTNCQSTASVTVAQPTTALTLNTTVNPITCIANGSFTATANGGWGSFTYTLTQPDASTVGPQNNGIFNNLSQAGNYTITVTDANGCTVTNNATLTTPVTPTLTISPTSTLCYTAATGSTIVVTASSGNPPYQYNINGSAFQSSNTFNGLTPGTYTINVTDSYGCTATVSQTILPALLAQATLTKALDCSTNPDAIISVNINGGTTPYQYQVNFNNGGFGALNTVTGNSFTFDTAAAGTYQFLITDAAGCTFTTNTITINPITNPQIINLAQTQQNICNGDNNGAFVVNINTSQGIPPFQYSIDGGTTYQNSNTFNGLTAGTYNVIVRDANLCTANASITLVEPDVLIGESEVIQELSCVVTGSIQAINVSGGTAPYQYSINGITFQASNVFTNLNAGTYTITIRDANNCVTTTDPITFVQPLPPTDIAFTSSSLTCPALTSNVTATITGGTAPYTAQITSPSTINATSVSGNVATFNNLAVGSYTFVVTDVNGCTYQENFTINPIPFINVTGNLVSNVVCFGTSTGAVTFNVSNISTTYSYTINGGTPVTNQTSSTINLTNLAAGNYTIVVTDTNTNCQSTASVTVAQPTTALTLNTTVNPITCIANGSFTATANGGWGSFTYTLTQPDASTVGPQNNGIFNNLSQAGNYTITVTDANGCTVTNNATLTTPVTPTLTISPTSTLCYTAATGSTIVVTASSGNPPYQYNINGSAFQSSNTFNGLTPGTYTINVTDSYGCTATVSQTILPALLAQATLTKALDCSTNPDAIISVNINGGTTPYQYQVNFNNGGFGALNTVTGNSFTFDTAAAGTYQFLITDAAGCTFTTNTITINPITNPQIINLAQTQQNICNGDNNGAFVVNINTSQGIPPFQYSIDGGTTYQNSNTFNGLTAGTYNVIVRDANLCTANASITLVEPDPINFDISITEITCNNPGGTSFGEVIFENISGGTLPYTYYLTSNFGYSDSYTTTSNEDHTFIVLNFGIYTAEVIDSNGCSLIQSNIIIASPPDDLDIDISTATADCVSGGTAIVTVSSLVSSGSYEFGILETNTLPYTTSYQLADPGTPETSTFTGLVPGVTYTFVVHDLITDCYYFETANGPIPTPSTLTTVINVVQNVTCTGSGNGTLSFTFDNYDPSTTSVSYEIFYAQSNLTTGIVGNSLTTGSAVFVQNFGVLSPGTYYILLTENGTGSANGCTSATPNFTISESTNQLTVTATLVKNDNCNLNAGIVTATGQFGTPQYQYQILPSTDPAPIVSNFAGTVSNTFTVEAGSYIVYIKDANNCIVASNIVVVGLDPSPQIALSVVDNCAQEGTFEINIIRTVDGVAPYGYLIDGSTEILENASSFTISNLLSGIHTVDMIDSNGCLFSTSITIDPIINGSAIVTVQPSCANNDGEIQATATNGSGNYSFELQDTLGTTIDGPNTTGLFNSLGFGDYNVIISDVTNSCSFSIPLSLKEPTPVSFTTTHENVSCNGASDGSISIALEPSNIDTPYTYSLFDGTTTVTQNSPIFTGLAAGNYTVTVTSSKNCTDTQVINITEPNALTLSLTADDFACNTNNTVSVVTITASVGAGTGTAPYLFSIDGTNYQSENTFEIVDNGSVQNLTITVQDANGCSINESITVNPLPTITDVTVAQNIQLTCSNEEEVIVTITGGSGNYTYQLLPNGPIVGPTTSNTATFSISTDGTYTFEVVDLTTGCSTITAPYTINPLPIITATAENAIAVNCYGDTNGSFEITVNGYSGNYQYNIYDDSNSIIASGNSNTSTNPLTLNNLAAGNYSVQIIATDPPFCETFSNVINVGSPVGPLGVTVTATNDNCNDDAGVVTATAQFGTAPYQYQLLPSTDPAPTVATFVAAPSNIFNEESGSYIVYVKDANDCLVASSVVIVDLDSSPIITLALVDACVNEGSFEIDATRTDGITPFTVSVDGGSPYTENGTNFTISNLLSGTHTVTITDANGCTDVQSITIDPIINGSAIVTVQPSCANNDGEIQATATNGSGNYSFELQDTLGTTIDGPNTTGLFNSLGFGDYNVIISDVTNSCSFSIPLSLKEPTPVSFTTTHENVSCNGASDGSISIALEPSNIDTPYTYSLFDGTTTVTQNSPIFTGLAAGNYTVTVTSSKNCTDTQVINITEPNALTLSLTADDFACNTNNTVSVVTITASVGAGTGTAPYLFSIDGTNYQSENTFEIVDNGSVQNLTITVQDANGCLISESITVNPLPVITDVIVTTEIELTCTNDEIVNVAIIGDFGNYTYQLLPDGPILGPTTITNAAFAVQSGTHTFEIVNVDTGCSFITEPFTVEPLPVITAIADNANAVNCYGEFNGSFEITVNGYSGNYQYNIYDDTNAIIASGNSNTSTNPLTLNNLAAGNYSVQIIATDPPFCETFSNSITVGSPANPLTLDLQQTADVTCNVPGLGTILAQGNGGNGTFEYELVNTTTSTTIQTFGTNNIFTSLNAGTYEVTVRDINLCETSQTIILDAPTPIDATYVLVNENLLCYNATNASVTITATGGQGSYQYTLIDSNGITSGPQIENIFDNLGAGTYTVTIEDGWDCSFTTLPFTITEPSQIQPTLNVESTLSCDNLAELVINVTGGTPPYQYSTDGITFNTTNTFDVGPGTYQYYVTDANNCTAILTNSVTIAPIDPLVVTINASNTTIQCNGDTNASITAEVTGGLGNYTYTLINANTSAIISGPQTSNIFSQLGAGNYIIRVNSEDCVQNSNTVIITQPLSPLNITNYTVNPATCNGTANGSITFNPTGGTPPYQYAITTHLDQFFDTNTFVGLGVGTYTVIVQDSKGCFETLTVQMTEPDPLVATLTVNNPELCEGNNDGTATISITGGTAPYFTSLDDDTPGSFIEGQFTFTNLDSTIEHTIFVHDANNCQTNIYIPASNPVTLTPSATVTYDCTTTAAPQNNTVTISVEAVNVGQVEFALDVNIPSNYQTSNIYTNLTNGTHTIYVKHNNGCIKTVDVTITNWIPVTETHTQVNVLCNSDTTGSITINGNGGNGTYQYAISPSFTYGTTNTFNNLAAGTYTIKVKDGNNCEIETPTITITEPTALNAIISDFGQDECIGDNLGYIQATISGGVGPYMASLNNTTNFQAVDSSNIVDYFNLAGGATYTIYFRDANGCITSVQQTLEPAVDLNPVVTVVYDCSNNQSTNTVTIVVNSIYQNDVLYSIDGLNYQASNTFIDVPAGNYTAYVDHVNGCLNSDETFTIDQIDPVDLVVTETGLNQITAVASGGVPPYTYVFNGTNTGSNNVFIFSQTGNQNVSVYDANGCEANFVIPTTFYPIEIPNFFTPDGNGFNDFWTPINIENFTNIESIIFDRYGREIIRLKLGESWDGTYESIDLPSGDYWYLINVNDGTGRSFAGNFTLYR